MGNVKYFLIIFMGIGMLFFSCKKITQQASQNINVLINNCNFISTNGNSNFSICYDSLVFDNRCPDLAMCARRGEVGVKLSFKLNNIVIPFRLADVASIIGNYLSDTTISGVHIKLIDVLPHPFSNQNNEKKVVLEIN
jgi:hypothetical protein